MPALLSDADVGFSAGPKLLSDADVGFAPQKQALSTPYSPDSIPAPDASPTDGGSVAHIADAAVQGWKDTPSILTDKGQEAVDKYGGVVGQTLVNPALKVAGGAIATAHAGMAALSQAAMEVFGEKGGRDALALLSVLPMAGGERMSPNVAAPASADVPAPRPRYISELTMPPDTVGLTPLHRIQDLIRHDDMENGPAAPDRGVANQSIADIGNAPNIDSAIAAAGKAASAPYVPITAAQAASRDGVDINEGYRRAASENLAGRSPEIAPAADPTPGAPALDAGQQSVGVPNSVGAAASREGTADTTFGRTAREIKGAQADMELADLMRTPQPGDARDIIPGATQTRAEIELSPSVSREAKGLRQEFREGFNDHEKANNEIYHNFLSDVVPTSEQVGTMKDLREAQWQANERSVFGSNPDGNPVSTAPIVQHMEDLFSDPIEKHNSYLRNALQPFMDKMVDEDGNPVQIGAKELYGIRQEMGRKVKDMATDTDLAHVRGQFSDLINVTDNAIIGGAPDYRTMMDQYREASIPINAGERLQQGALKITNGSDRTITFGKFDAFMKGLWMERNGPNPYAPAKDIDQGTWDHLMLLHERLARSASDQELARARGSDTTQMAMELARKGMIGIAHAGVAKLTGGLGNIAIPIITKQIDQARALRRVGEHLNPDLSNYPPVVP